MDGYKSYPTKAAAFKAIGQFVRGWRYPTPSAIVDSGGGWHIYWFSKTPLAPEDWRRHSTSLWAAIRRHGLQADNVTTDAARVLRVPGTFNHKRTVPEAVRLVHLRPASEDFDFATFPVTQVAVVTTSPTTSAKTPLFSHALFPKQAYVNPVIDGLRVDDGVLAKDCRRHEIDVEPRAVFKECPMFHEAYKTGGADASQGLWMHQVLAMTFLQDGRKLAHRISSGYSTYSPGETDEMYDRKVADREAIGLGWPSCATFQREGSKQCATCIHKGKIKSPLNLGLPAARPDLGGIIGQVKEAKIKPVAALMTLRDQGADIKQLLARHGRGVCRVNTAAKSWSRPSSAMKSTL